VISYISYGFGNIPAVQQHFSVVILAIIIISVIPPFVEFFRTKFKKS